MIPMYVCLPPPYFCSTLYAYSHALVCLTYDETDGLTRPSDASLIHRRIGKQNTKGGAADMEGRGKPDVSERMARFWGLKEQLMDACLHFPGLLRCLVTLLTYMAIILLGTVFNSCLSGRCRHGCSGRIKVPSSIYSVSLHSTTYTSVSLGRMSRFSVDIRYQYCKRPPCLRHGRRCAARRW
ncbi:hypothetical protein F4781DRAFT_200883 [Annulohypoxylon bovei var. microspora]|nr:hypothetical protein F4781DRAFT_200883 [Annulohypoxylon bovei var. microspora]